MVQLDTVDGTALHAHADVLDSGHGIRADAPWDNFKTSTVERFLEYCYQGDYSAPKPVKPLLATPTSSVDDRDDCEDEGNKDDGRAGDIEDSDTEDGTGLGHPDGLDYREVFFTHAELYVLSQTQRRSSLTALCLNRLRKALDKAGTAPVRPRFANNLSDLLLYVYEHSNVGLIDDQQAHDLQNLVSSCAAMHIKEMKEECSLLMRCGGKMAEDLMKEVVYRVVGLERMLKKEKEARGKEDKERKEKQEKQRKEKEEKERKEKEEKERKEKEEKERREREERERKEREERERREREENEERERREREERERMEREEREEKERVEREERERAEREERERVEREERERVEREERERVEREEKERRENEEKKQEQ